jgi:hypothetical protein
MTATSEFFTWFYFGLNGLGGWFLFLVIAVIAMLWLIYDSSSRHIPALGWRLGVFVTAAFLLPALIWRLSSAETRDSLANFVEWIFYLGLLGGTIPPVLAVGYYVTYQGQQAAVQQQAAPPQQQGGYAPPAAAPRDDYPRPRRGGRIADEEETQPPPRARGPRKEKASAWLDAGGHTYQLFMGETTIGRHSSNDIRFEDKSVSREHAKIKEQNGHFTLIDLGSSGGTRLNGQRVQGPTQLEHDDEIAFSDTVVVTFISRER